MGIPGSHCFGGNPVRMEMAKLGMGVSVKAENDWRGVGRPQVAMHCNVLATVQLTNFQRSIIDCVHVCVTDSDLRSRAHRNIRYLASICTVHHYCAPVRQMSEAPFSHSLPLPLPRC